MNNVMFSHIVQRNQKLNGKSSNQTHRNTLEIIAFNKFIQVHTQHFKYENKMLSKSKLIYNFNDVLFVFWIVRAQSFEDFSLNKPLFIKSLFISQHLQTNCFPCFVVIAFENLSEGTFT